MQQLIANWIGRQFAGGSLELVTPQGRHWRLGEQKPVLRVRVRDVDVLRRIVLNPRLALGEAYMHGELEPDNASMGEVLALVIRNAKALAGHPAIALLDRLRARLGQFNLPLTAARHARHHYDIDFEVYRAFLDQDLHYSCAYFSDPAMSLEAAQQAKAAHIAAKLDLRPGQRVLDIGSGWGSLAMYLAQHHGVHCTGITLSPEQLERARERARQRGLQGQVDFQLRDYREMDGRYDAVVSVGMFEHVGRPQYGVFFRKVQELLAPDGVALLHTIGHGNTPVGADPWIRKYIFPGSHIPAASEIFAEVEDTDLIASDMEVWRLHYALTLEHWNARFQQHRAVFRKRLGEEFCRMWELYLQGCALVFRHGDLVVFQLQLTRSLDRLPLTRDYLYRPEALAEESRPRVVGGQGL